MPLYSKVLKICLAHTLNVIFLDRTLKPFHQTKALQCGVDEANVLKRIIPKVLFCSHSYCLARKPFSQYFVLEQLQYHNMNYKLKELY